MDAMQVWSIARSPSDSNLILAGTRPGALFRSTDGGKFWNKIDAGIPDTCLYVTYPVSPRSCSIRKTTIWSGSVSRSVACSGARRRRDLDQGIVGPHLRRRS